MNNHAGHCSHQVVDDVRVVVDCLVHHEAKDTHLGRAAIVKLDRLAGQNQLQIDAAQKDYRGRT